MEEANEEEEKIINFNDMDKEEQVPVKEMKE
jgi:hypothetical protein